MMEWVPTNPADELNWKMTTSDGDRYISGSVSDLASYAGTWHAGTRAYKVVVSCYQVTFFP